MSDHGITVLLEAIVGRKRRHSDFDGGDHTEDEDPPEHDSKRQRVESSLAASRGHQTGINDSTMTTSGTGYVAEADTAIPDQELSARPMNTALSPSSPSSPMYSPRTPVSSRITGYPPITRTDPVLGRSDSENAHERTPSAPPTIYDGASPESAHSPVFTDGDNIWDRPWDIRTPSNHSGGYSPLEFNIDSDAEHFSKFPSEYQHLMARIYMRSTRGPPEPRKKKNLVKTRGYDQKTIKPLDISRLRKERKKYKLDVAIEGKEGKETLWIDWENGMAPSVDELKNNPRVWQEQFKAESLQKIAEDDNDSLPDLGSAEIVKTVEKGKAGMIKGGWTGAEIKRAQEEASQVAMDEWHREKMVKQFFSKQPPKSILGKRAADATSDQSTAKRQRVQFQEPKAVDRFNRPVPKSVLGQKRAASEEIQPSSRKKQALESDERGERTHRIKSDLPVMASPHIREAVARSGGFIQTKKPQQRSDLHYYISREEKREQQRLDKHRKQAQGSKSTQAIAIEAPLSKKNLFVAPAYDSSTAHIASSTTRDLLASSSRTNSTTDLFTITSQKHFQLPLTSGDTSAFSSGDLPTTTESFPLTAEHKALLYKAAHEGGSAFTPTELAEAEALLPHLGYQARRKLRNRLNVPPSSNTQSISKNNTAQGYHGGSTKGRRRRPRRGIPDQPRGPKKEKDFDCRDGVKGNCPRDCAGRIHKDNNKKEQNPNCKKKGELMIGMGVEIGTWAEVRGDEGEWDATKSRKAKQRAMSLAKKPGKGIRKRRPVV